MDMPDLVTLAATSLLMAAKIEEPIEPSFNRLIKTLKQVHGVDLKKKSLLDMEEQMIRVLDFNLRKASPILFLERFLRLFGLDKMTNNKAIKVTHVILLASQYCRFMQHESCFLKFRPSQMAAASLLFSINLIQSDIAKSVVDLDQITQNKLTTFI